MQKGFYICQKHNFYIINKQAQPRWENITQK